MKIIEYFKALGDETRLRIFNLLLRYELNVNELVSVMDMGQSRISRHLKILTGCGLLTSRRDGLMVFYRAAENGRENDIISLLSDIIEYDSDLESDLNSLEKLVNERAREKNIFFDNAAPNWDVIRNDIIGGISIADEIALRLKKVRVAADLGCGNGGLLPVLRKKAGKVIGIDRSPRMLDEAHKRLGHNGKGIELRIGEIEHLPMRDGEADVAVMSMVLHYLINPPETITEAARVLKKDDSLIIVDLEKHASEDLRSRYGHRWLGFDPGEMTKWLSASGMKVDEIASYNVKNDLKVNLYHSRKL